MSLCFLTRLARRAGLVMLVLSALSLQAIPADKPASMEEQLNLAALMVKDHHYQRVLGLLLPLVPPEEEGEKESARRRRYHTLLAVAYLGLKQYHQAREQLRQALKEAGADPLLYVYLGQAEYKLKNYRAAIDAIGKAGALVDKYPALYEMLAQSHWALKQPDRAWRVLARAQRKFPGDLRYMRRQVFYLIERELYGQASELGMRYLSLSHGSAKDYAALGNALRLGGQLEMAARVLEKGRLLFARDITLAKLLAHVYLARDMPLAGAAIMEQAAVFDPDLRADAVELYRRAGRYYKALYLNRLVKDPKTRLRQRVALLLALERYEQVVGMRRPLLRAGLLKDDAILYAFAYAGFRTGQFDLSRRYLGRIKSPRIFRQAAELRRLMDQCQSAPWQCA